jgi:SagB-type dehydrogenase family enzyme
LRETVQSVRVRTKSKPMSTLPLDSGNDAIALPPPALPPQVTLESVLKRRHSTRAFLPDALPLEVLSTLLWAAFGINRPQSHGRTAPSAHGWQETDVYAFLPEGACRYDAHGQRLLRVSAEDLRRFTGMQDFVETAPLDLVFVADFSRMSNVREDDRAFLAGADAGCIAQNVYLCCAAMGLATVVRGMVDRRSLARVLGLAPTQRITLAQTVGYPGREA